MPKIQRMEGTLLSFPLKRPFSNHTHLLTEVHGINLSLSTESDFGSSFLYGLQKFSYKKVLEEIKKNIAQPVFQFREDPSFFEQWKMFWAHEKKKNLEQDQLYALALVDIAVWDLYLKKIGFSLHEYLGASQTKIPLYGTSGWLSLSTNELLEECHFYAKSGISAFKLRLGHAEDLLRVKVLRDAMGANFILMADANRRYEAHKASEIAKELLPYNLLWIEEPTDSSLFQMEKIKKTCALPVALGENILEESDFRSICQKKWTDYLQPDLPRCGGITGFVKAAQIAQEFSVPLCSHLMPQLSAGLVAAFPHGVWVEQDNLLPEGIFTEKMNIEKGFVIPQESAGNGVSLTGEALKKYGTFSEVMG